MAKSFVPGKGFVSASKLGKPGLRKVVKPGQYRSTGPDEHQKLVSDAIESNRAMFRSVRHSAKKGKDGVYREANPDMLPGLAGMAWKYGGKDGKRIYQYSPAHNTKRMETHELAHVAPKRRTEWRLGTIVSDANKSAREEARAEMKTGQYFRQKHDPKSGFDSAYNATARSPLARAAMSGQAKTGRAINALRQPRDAIEQATGIPKSSPRLAEAASHRFGPSYARSYRKTQDKIAGAQNIKVPRSKDARLRQVAAEGAGVAALGAGSYAMLRDPEKNRTKR